MTRSPLQPITRQSGSTTERGSSAAPMRQVPLACWASEHSANIQSSSSCGPNGCSIERPVVPYSTRVDDRAHVVVPADLAQPAHAVAHAQKVAVVAQHALVDPRVDGGIARGDAHAAFAEGLEGRDGEARARRAAVLRRPQVARDHDHVVDARSGEAGGIAQAAVGVAVRQRAHLRVRTQLERQAQDRMVEQMLADRPLGHDFDAEAFKQAARPDAGALQDRRRMDRAGRQDHLAPRPHRFALAAHLHAHAVGMRAIAFEGQRVDHRVADDREVGAVARRFEVSVVDRDAQALAAVDRVGRHAGPLRRVVVVAPAVAQRHRRLHQGAVDMAPLLDRARDRRGSGRSCRARARRRNRHRFPACGSRSGPPASPSPWRPRRPSRRNPRGCRGWRSGR